MSITGTPAVHEAAHRAPTLPPLVDLSRGPLRGTAGASAVPQSGVSALGPHLPGSGLFECRKFREAILRRHLGIGHLLTKVCAKAEAAHGYVVANQVLGEVDRELTLGDTGLTADCTDGQLNDFARHFSLTLQSGIAKVSTARGIDAALTWAHGKVAPTGVDFPLAKLTNAGTDAKAGCLARLGCEKWWRGQLRKVARRRLEHFMRRHGFVSARAGAYVSDITLGRIRADKLRNRGTLEQLRAVSDAGDELDLLDIIDGSVSNPAIRRCELMTRMRGTEELASQHGLVGCFMTLTCPSKYHAQVKRGVANPKYNHTTPREAQAYLRNVFAIIRARWARQGIVTFGFRVAEPHHDGTPHWHLMLFFSPTEVDAACATFREVALREDGDEPGAHKHRATIVRIDPKRGSATGYLAKYIAKNIDAFGVGEDFEAALPGQDGAERACAWGSAWGIRQFQPIGSVSVTVYREFRRLDGRIEGADTETLEQLRAACDAGEWATFVELMGGVFVRRNEQTARLVRADSLKKSLYGEKVLRILGIALRAGGSAARIAKTRTKVWKVERKEQVRATGPP